MWLTRAFVARPTLIAVLIALVSVAGFISLRTLTQQQFPNVDIPTVNVSVSYPGASTSEMRDAIVRPLEDQLAGAPDLDHLDTSIQQGRASITAAFALGSDKNSDLVEVQRRVQSAEHQLPTDLQAPVVSTFVPSQATVVTLNVLSYQLTPNDLSALVTNKIVPAIEQVPGISNVNPIGIVQPSLEVTVDPVRLDASGFTINDVVNAIAPNNVRAPGGIAYAPNHETTIDIRGDITGPESVAGLVLNAPNSSGAAAGPGANAGYDPWTVSQRLYRVGDVANVTSSYEPRRTYSFYDGNLSITLNVTKATGASEVSSSQGVLKALPAIQRKFPQVIFRVVNVQSVYTQQQLTNVLHTLAEGIVLTGIVMLLFLGSWRNAMVVLIAIPTSLAIALSIMKIANFTIDTISLLAMTLIIGILVDDSIVVLENIERHRHMGQGPEEAALKGRSEIGLAALVITLVDVVVFLPIAFLPGTVGLFLKEFGLVVVVATLTSLFISFTVTPGLAGNWSMRSNWTPPRFIQRFGRGFDRVRDWYAQRVLPWGLQHRWWVVAFSLVTLAGAIALIPLGAVGFEFIPAVDRGEVFVQVTYPTGTPLETTRNAVHRIEVAIDGNPDVRAENAVAGGAQAAFGGFVQEGSVGQVHVFLKDRRRLSTYAWVRKLQSIAHKAAPGAKTVAIPATGAGGGVAQPIDYLVTNANGEPDSYAAQVARVLQATPGAANVNSSALNLAPQINVIFNRDLARALDVSIGTASTAIRSAFGGDVVTQYTTAQGFRDVQVIYPHDSLHNFRSILNIPIRSNSGNIVYVGDVATLQYKPAPPLITRENRETVVHVSANVQPGATLSNVQRNFTARLKKMNFPAGVLVKPAAQGNQQNLRDTTVGIGAALGLATLLVFLLMVALFNSYRAPFIIMFAVPVAVVGALGALAVTHLTLNLFSMIGTVLLIGLVSKNGILLVDFATRLHNEGAGKLDAITRAANIRFRPIIMTTIAMICGMLPLALALEPGGQTRQALGVVVIGGLSSSLLLTLVLVPIVFMWITPEKAAPVHVWSERPPSERDIASNAVEV